MTPELVMVSVFMIASLGWLVSHALAGLIERWTERRVARLAEGPPPIPVCGRCSVRIGDRAADLLGDEDDPVEIEPAPIGKRCTFCPRPAPWVLRVRS